MAPTKAEASAHRVNGEEGHRLPISLVPGGNLRSQKHLGINPAIQRTVRDFYGSTCLTPASAVSTRHIVPKHSQPTSADNKCNFVRAELVEAALVPLKQASERDEPEVLTPEQKARRQFEHGITSCVRVIVNAVPGKRLAVFKQQAREAFDLAFRGGLDLEDVGDRLYNAGAYIAELDKELGDGWNDKLTAALGEAKMAAVAKLEIETAPSPSIDNASSADGKTTAITGARSLVLNRLSDMEMRPVDWHWRARLAAGKHTALAGDPGAGKSSVTMSIAAAYTTGGIWPCGEGRAPVGSVVVLSAEDGEADTIKPRLVAAGGDPSRVYVISATKEANSQRTFNLQADLDLLEKAIEKIGDVLLVIIDPVSSYLGKVDGHKNSEVRGVLEPLSEMAARFGVAILSVTHFSKDGSGKSTKTLHRFVGSIAFIGAPRMAFTVMPDPEDQTRSLFLHVKNNLAAPPKGLAFRKEQREAAPGIIASAVVWDLSHVDNTADETLSGGNAERGRTAKDEAVDFLRDALAGGPVEVLELEAQARQAGLLGDGKPLRQNKAFRAARELLGVLYEREGFGKGARYLLRLPDASCAPSKAIRALSPDGAHMEIEGAHDDQGGNK